MALKPRKGIFIARVRVSDDRSKSSQVQGPNPKEAPNHKPPYRRAFPLKLVARGLFGIWDSGFGVSQRVVSIPAGQRNEHVFERRRDGPDVRLANAHAGELLANQLLGHGLID